MKKFLNTLLCLMLSLALVLSFAACSKDKDDAKDDEETSKSDTVKEDEKDSEKEDEKDSEKEDEKEPEEEADDEAAKKVKEYVEKNQDQVDEGMSVSAKGTSVVFTFEVPEEEATEETIDMFFEMMEEESATMLEGIQEEEPAVTSLIFVLVDQDGNELGSKEYK